MVGTFQHNSKNSEDFANLIPNVKASEKKLNTISKQTLIKDHDFDSKPEEKHYSRNGFIK
jgi:hypothetical protein